MPRTPQISGKEVVKILNKLGFVVINQTGSHIKLRRKIGGATQTVIVPNHRVVRKGTFHNILSMAHLSLDDVLNLKK